MRFLLALAATMMLSLPTHARPLEADETKQLVKSVGIYLRAIGRNEHERVVEALPPRVLNVFAGQAGIEAKKLVPTMAAQMKELMKDSQFSDFTAQETGLDANDAAMADGSTVTWVLVETSFVAETGGKKSRHEQPLLVLREGDKWYMMRIEGAAQQQLVSFAYPFLKDVKMPASRTTPMN